MASAKKGDLYKPDLDRNLDDQVWFRFSVGQTSRPKFEVYTQGGALQRTLDVGGDVPAGEYTSRSRAMFWNRADEFAAPLAPGVYFVRFYVDSVEQALAKFTLN